jgi:hypothetical protein
MARTARCCTCGEYPSAKEQVVKYEYLNRACYKWKRQHTKYAVGRHCNNAVAFELEKGNSPRRLADDERWSISVMTYATILMRQPE